MPKKAVEKDASTPTTSIPKRNISEIKNKNRRTEAYKQMRKEQRQVKYLSKILSSVTMMIHAYIPICLYIYIYIYTNKLVFTCHDLLSVYKSVFGIFFKISLFRVR